MKSKLFGLALAMLVFGGTLTASAQHHSIRISEGRVFIDGHEQARRDLPETLELEGVTASLSFSGMTRFQIGGITYVIEDGALSEANSGNRDAVVVLGRAQFGSGNWVMSNDSQPNVWRKDNNPKAYNVFFELLDNQVTELNEATEAFSREQSLHVATRVNRSAENAAIMVRAFPQIELQAYMEGIQHRDRGLYDGMLREHLMEMETHRLASQLLATDSAARRAELRDELQANLDEIFELKQSNRRAEVEQLDIRLRELRSQMDTREENRDEIILRRIRQLLNEID